MNRLVPWLFVATVLAAVMLLMGGKASAQNMPDAFKQCSVWHCTDGSASSGPTLKGIFNRNQRRCRDFAAAPRCGARGRHMGACIAGSVPSGPPRVRARQYRAALGRVRRSTARRTHRVSEDPVAFDSFDATSDVVPLSVGLPSRGFT
jgi:hypothetical protein